jgi:hypothetical protein
MVVGNDSVIRKTGLAGATVGMFLCDFSRRYATLLQLSATAALAVFLSSHDTALAQSAPKWLPSISFEAKPGTKRNLGEGDLFAPLAQNDSTLLFGNVRARFDDADSLEGNFGLGVRHMLASGWNLGAYGYYDRRKTGFDNYFSQATFGVEALGRDFDFRANAYLPLGEQVKTFGFTPGGATFASIVGTTIQVATLGAAFREERALQGFDAEVGWRVPIWSADDSKALRLYAGMFRFEDSTVKEIIGPRLRAELAMYEVPHLWEGTRLTLGAEFQHDDVRGSQGFGLVRLSVPLGTPARSAKLTAQERRMTDRIVRDVDIVTQAASRRAPSIVETATKTSGNQPITVIDSATTSGAALANTLISAGAGSMVILKGTFNTTATTTLQSGQTVMGAGTVDVQTASGRTATLTTSAATINAALHTQTAAVDMSTNSTLTGMTINTSNSGTVSIFGARADGASGVTIANNTIFTTSPVANSFGIRIENGASAIVTGNIITADRSTPGSNAVALFILTATARVSGNTLTATGSTPNEVYLDGATVLSGSTGNVHGGGTCNIYSSASGSTPIYFTNNSTCGP